MFLRRFSIALAIGIAATSGFVPAHANCPVKSWEEIARLRSVRQIAHPPLPALTGPQDVLNIWKQRFPPVLQAQPAHRKAILAMDEDMVDVLAISAQNKVKFTGDHLREVRDGIMENADNVAILEARGFNRYGYVGGVADSDKGKDPAYLAFFTARLGDPGVTDEVVQESNRFLSALTMRKLKTRVGPDGKVIELGTERTVEAFEEFFERAGLPKTFFNRDASVEEVRETLRKAFMAQGFFHELPGMRDASYLLELGYISKEQFIDRIRHNFAHNGPRKGFWEFFGNVIAPGQAAKAGATDQLEKIAKGGVFEGRRTRTADGTEIYQLGYQSMRWAKRTPANVLNHLGQAKAKGEPIREYEQLRDLIGLDVGPPVHQVSDRLSVASQNGVLKITHEIGTGNVGAAIANAESLLVGNPALSLQQIEEIVAQGKFAAKERIDLLRKARELGHVDSRQFARLQSEILSQWREVDRLARSSERYIRSYRDFVAKNFEFNPEKTAFTIKFPNGKSRRFEVEGATGPNPVLFEVTGKGQRAPITGQELLDVIESRLALADQRREIAGTARSTDALAPAFLSRFQ